MWDDSATEGWRRRRPSVTHLLGGALVICLALIVYLLARPEVRAAALSPLTERGLAATPARTAAPTSGRVAGQTNPSAGPAESSTLTGTGNAPLLGTDPAGGLQTSGLMSNTLSSTADIDAVAAQLQEMQSALADMSTQLGMPVTSQVPFVTPPTLVAPQTRYSGLIDAIPEGTASVVSTSELVTEIERLNQIMQPLEVQLETAIKANRPSSELAAMRAQMSDIHQRLNNLMARLQTAKGSTPATNSSGLNGLQPTANSANSVEPDDAKLDQLLQTMTEIQTTLQQMQAGGASSTPTNTGLPGSMPGMGGMGGMH